MRAHLRVLLITIAVAVGSGSAQAAEFVHRPLTLPRGDWALDFGLGLHHIRNPDPNRDYTGFGLNLEAQVGITSFLQLGLRTGLRIGDEGRASQADSFGRMFDFETYGTYFDTVADPEIALTWALVHSTVELGLQGRLYLPTEDHARVGIMLAVPMNIHLGSSARLDTGLFVPIIFTDPTFTEVSLPFHLWFQASHQTYLGPLIGFRFPNHGQTQVPLGFGLGYAASYDVDLKTWLMFDDINQDAKDFGAGGGIQVRF